MAAKHNITIDQGATFVLSLAWKVDSAAVNLTGFTARMMVRENYDDAVPQLSLTSGAGEIALGATDGSVVVTASAAKTAAITALRGYYDIELESPTGVVTRLIEGRVTVKPEATK